MVDFDGFDFTIVPTPWDNWMLDPDPRSAAEIMTAGATRPGCLPHDPSVNRGAGPAASQIFDAAVMREQVDPHA